ncbi:MAG: hypothetical protein EZS28_054768, partial [Streblomastix strix]
VIGSSVFSQFSYDSCYDSVERQKAMEEEEEEKLKLKMDKENQQDMENNDGKEQGNMMQYYDQYSGWAVIDATIIQLIFSATIIQAEVPTKNSSYQLMLIHPSNFELFSLIPEFSWPNQLFHSVPVSIITPMIHV